MRRADRLFQIVQYLRGGRLLRAEDLAERLEVSKRTIYRDIADLIGSGVPIDGEAGIGYLMRDGYDLPPLMFTSDEIVALVAGARLIRTWGGQNMALAVEEALMKIQSVLPETVHDRLSKVEIHAMSGFGLDKTTRARLDQIEKAEYQRLRLEIVYCDENDAKSRRAIRPLGLFFWGRVWTLIAWCELRDDFRAFRVDRIRGMKECGQFRSEKDKTLQSYLARECASF